MVEMEIFNGENGENGGSVHYFNIIKYLNYEYWENI